MKLYRYPTTAAKNRLKKIVRRGADFSQKDMQRVGRIVNDVRRRGDAALVQYSREFDCPSLSAEKFEVTKADFKTAAKAVDRRFVTALNRAILQIKDYHARQLPNSWHTMPRPGTLLGQLVRPVDAAGVYVPGAKGGTTPLVSSVLMSAIPAKIAGVPKVVMVTPPRSDGSVAPELIVAAERAGIDAVYKIGSAWAIAALAYGTATVPQVDVIVGPGNMYVTMAKKIVSATVAIDMIAGPSEILVIADDSADPEYVATDLLSQAEHDEQAAALLITTDEQTGRRTAAAIEAELKTLPRREIAARSLERYGTILSVPDLATAIDLANQIAPEHLELLIRNPFDHIAEIRHAGAIFVGNYSPEPVGDYIAGPNHVLPTAGTARFSSALSVDHFLKKTSLIRYSREAFQREAKDVIKLAKVEGLEAHARAMAIRLEKLGKHAKGE